VTAPSSLELNGVGSNFRDTEDLSEGAGEGGGCRGESKYVANGARRSKSQWTYEEWIAKSERLKRRIRAASSRTIGLWKKCGRPLRAAVMTHIA